MVETTVQGNPDVLVMHRKAPMASCWLVSGKLLKGDGGDVLFVLDEGNRHNISDQRARWVPLRRERWNDLAYSELTQCYPDSRMLVTHMALVAPVWEAMRLTAAFSSVIPPSIQDSNTM